MQPFNPRPSLQPIQRQTGGLGLPPRQLNIPNRYPGVVNQAMHHHFDDTVGVPPQYRDHAAPSPTPTYANTNAALFGAPVNEQSQTYTPGSVSRVPRHSFPFRALMIALIIVAAAAGIYTGIRVFSSPDPVNAGHTTNTVSP